MNLTVVNEARRPLPPHPVAPGTAMVVPLRPFSGTATVTISFGSSSIQVSFTYIAGSDIILNITDDAEYTLSGLQRCHSTDLS